MFLLYIQKNTIYSNLNRNTPKFWAKYIKRKGMSLILYISLGKIQKFTIYIGKQKSIWAKQRKERDYSIYIRNHLQRNSYIYIMNLGKVQKNIYIGNTGARYIRNRYLLYIGILSDENLKRKSVYFLYIRRKSIYRKIHKFWAK